MVVQEIAYALQDQSEVVTIVNKESKEEFEANAYLLKRLLATVEHISADNLKLTVSEKDFEGIKKHFGL